jgi:hypothetical protein
MNELLSHHFLFFEVWPRGEQHRHSSEVMPHSGCTCLRFSEATTSATGTKFGRNEVGIMAQNIRFNFLNHGNYVETDFFFCAFIKPHSTGALVDGMEPLIVNRYKGPHLP